MIILMMISSFFDDVNSLDCYTVKPVLADTVLSGHPLLSGQ